MAPALINNLRVAEHHFVLTHRFEATHVSSAVWIRSPSVSDFRAIYLGEFGQTRRHHAAILGVESNVARRNAARWARRFNEVAFTGATPERGPMGTAVNDPAFTDAIKCHLHVKCHQQRGSDVVILGGGKKNSTN